ncbi:hypothetical protein, partial [Mycobacterium tuberculosis]|uniref:hypothetical protein n=1 Tax=Mycobacterium tuberculosis TaxID=1773 RepID=UPI0039E3B72A
MLHCNPEFLHVVRPKTPRGETETVSTTIIRRLSFDDATRPTLLLHVLRPKTPRGDTETVN